MVAIAEPATKDLSLTRAQASVIHNYARLTFIEIAKQAKRKKESYHSFICCGGTQESSRIHNVTPSVTVLATSISRSNRAEYSDKA
jgi:hypothetical protein